MQKINLVVGKSLLRLDRRTWHTSANSNLFHQGKTYRFKANQKFGNLMQNLHSRSDERPGWKLLKHMFHESGWRFQGDNSKKIILKEKEIWRQDTNKWTLNLVSKLGISFQDVTDSNTLFPIDFEMDPIVNQALTAIPYGKTAVDYIKAYEANRAVIASTCDRTVFRLARALYYFCKEPKEEQVDDFVYPLLQITGFDHGCLKVGLKPRLEIQKGINLISIPDFAILKETLMNVPRIVAVSVEDKTLRNVGLAQAVGSSLTASLVNYQFLDAEAPLISIRARGRYISFMKVLYPRAFMENLENGVISNEVPVECYLLPGRPSRGIHVGYDLLDETGRRQALETLQRISTYVSQIAHEVDLVDK